MSARKYSVLIDGKLRSIKSFTEYPKVIYLGNKQWFELCQIPNGSHGVNYDHQENELRYCGMLCIRVHKDDWFDVVGAEVE